MNVNDNDIYKKFGEIVLNERKKQGLSQFEISKKLEIPQTTYSGYEKGTRKVSLPMIRNICEVLNIEVDVLFETLGIENMNDESKKIYKEFGDRIKSFREERNMTIEDISKLLGVAKNTYCNYEKGNRRIPLLTVVTLSKIFGVSVDELISGDNIERIDNVKLTRDEYRRVVHYAKLLEETRNEK